MKWDHVSPSQLDLASKCGEAFRRRYILGERRPPSAAMITGTGVDRSVSSNLESKVLYQKLQSDEEVSDIAAGAIEEEWEKGVALSAEELKEGAKKIKGEVKDSAVRMALIHAHQRAPSMDPVLIDGKPGVQRWVRLNLKGYGTDLVGIIDVQEAHRVTDTKTSKNGLSQEIADRSLQLTTYALAVEIIDGLKLEVALDVIKNTKRPEMITLVSSRTQEDHQVLLRRVEALLRMIEKGVFVPARQDDWWCSKKWCGYFNDCKFVNQGRAR